MVEVSDSERISNLIMVDEPVPCVITRSFGTYKDGQTGVALRCMENVERVGPEVMLELNDSSIELGSTELTFERPLPKDSKIEITFSLAPDGQLKLHGKDLTTSREIDAEFKTSAVYGRAEVEEMKSRNLKMSVS
jgi:molecular chaperone DnaK (HSP70)